MSPQIVQEWFGVAWEDIPGLGFLADAYQLAKALFILADVLLIVVFIYALIKGWKFRPRLEMARVAARARPTLRSEIFKERWERILRSTAGNSPDSLRIAVIEADSLVDDFLKQTGAEGEHMADRLSALNPEEVTTLTRLWRAHRARNDLVHTPGFYLSPEEAAQYLKDYEAFLREMGALN
jgi:hypothetical protein